MNSAPIILISVLLAALTASILLKLTSSAGLKGRLDQHIQYTLHTQNAAEELKAEQIAVMRQYKLSTTELRAAIQIAQAAGVDCSVTPTTWQAALLCPHTPAEESSNVKVQMVGVSSNSPAPSIHYSEDVLSWSDPKNPAAKVHSEKVRTRLGQNSVFSNAWTGNHFDCVFCHAHVYGDIGEYGNHTDGHGTHNDRFHGNWWTGGANLMATPITANIFVTGASSNQLPTYDQNVVPDLFTGWPPDGVPSSTSYHFMRSFQAQYTGPQLPYNLERQKQMLPKFDPDSTLVLATGKLSGGNIYTVPYGANGQSVSPTIAGSPIQGIYNGNAILDGRPVNGHPNPLQISGRVFFGGDVVVMGQVTGKGAIYSGRNIYIADDLYYVNPPQLFDGSQASNAVMDFVSQNAASLATDPRMQGDQLALFAANNIVINDPYDPYSGPGGNSVTSAADTAIQGLTSQMIYSQSDVTYADTAIFPSYFGQLALDKTTGYMLDMDAVNPNSTQFLFPWATAGQYLDSSRIHMTATSNYDPTNPASAPSDPAWYLDSLGGSIQLPYYQDLFYPKNMVNGGLVSWITKPTFLNCTWHGSNCSQTNASFQNASSAQPFLGADATDPRRATYKQAGLPLFKENPYDANVWKTGTQIFLAPPNSPNTEGALTTIDNLTGMISELTNAAVKRNTLVKYTSQWYNGGPTQYTLNSGTVIQSGVTSTQYNQDGSVIQTNPDGSTAPLQNGPNGPLPVTGDIQTMLSDCQNFLTQIGVSGRTRNDTGNPLGPNVNFFGDMTPLIVYCALFFHKGAVAANPPNPAVGALPGQRIYSDGCS